MNHDPLIERLVLRQVDRINDANVYFLKTIGESIKKIKELTPSEAQKLIQILKYGGNYDNIVREISKYTNMNVNEINEIFEKYASIDQAFYKQFYQYRDIPFVPYSENDILKRQTMALADITKNEMANFTRSTAIGYTVRDIDGTPKFMGLRSVYERLLDDALLSVSQGKDTFDSTMYRILKEIAESGLKTLEYESGRSIRLDSAIRMHLKDGLRNLHNENQILFGKEFQSDGVEISVHGHPAPDHAEVQGHQFSNEEFEKFQNDEDAVDYRGVLFESEYDGRDRRSISQYNCYHYVFSIILGSSTPQYTSEQLQEIIDTNNKGFEYEGKHYTMYEGEQLLRNIELELRKSKDSQILGRASDNGELVMKSQDRITKLTRKYHEVLKESGLPSRLNRARVSGYKRVHVDRDTKSL